MENEEILADKLQDAVCDFLEEYPNIKDVKIIKIIAEIYIDENGWVSKPIINTENL